MIVKGILQTSSLGGFCSEDSDWREQICRRDTDRQILKVLISCSWLPACKLQVPLFAPVSYNWSPQRIYRHLFGLPTNSLIGNSSSPNIQQQGQNNTKKIGDQKWQRKLVERGKMWIETLRSRPRSDLGSI